MTEFPPLTHWIGFLLARAHHRAHAIFQDALSPLELTPKSFGALSTIAARGPMSQAALGETLHIDRTTMVAIVDELERSGRVERGRNSADRRIHSLVATAKGLETLRAAEDIARSSHEELLAGLAPEDRDELRALLARIAG